MDDCFRASGNCVPACLAFLFDDWQRLASWLNQPSAENEAAELHGCRNYRDCSKHAGYELRPSLGVKLCSPGKFILHTEHRGHASAVALDAISDEECRVLLDTDVHVLPLQTVLLAAQESVDVKSMVTFQCFRKEDQPPADASGPWMDLLELQAGHVPMAVHDEQGGAALPTDLLVTLATLLFETGYLCNVAACSKALRRAVKQRAMWQQVEIDLRLRHAADILNLSRSRLTRSLLRSCKSILLSLDQLDFLPDPYAVNVLLHWSGRFLPTSDHRIQLWMSDDLLLGHGEVRVRLGDGVAALWLGAVGADLQVFSFCNILRPFEASMEAAYGLSGYSSIPLRCAGPLPPPEFPHVLSFTWTSSMFCACLDGCKLSKCVLRAGTNRGPSVNARFFLEVLLTQRTRAPVCVEALPAPTRSPDVVGGSNREDREDSLSQDFIDNVSSGPEASDEESCQGVDDIAPYDVDGPVAVGDGLLKLLKEEVTSAVRSVRNSPRYACRLCPARCFTRADRLAHHIHTYHAEKQQYCCSGSKQLRLIQALFDYDQLQSKPGGARYLQRSSALLRSTVSGLDFHENAIDKHIRLVLTERGPVFKHRANLDQFRRVKNLYYSHGFADLFYQELLISHAKMKTAACLHGMVARVSTSCARFE